jgi:serine/threonine protein kinase
MLAELIEEFLGELEAGNSISPSDFAGRYPEHAGALSQLLPALEALADLGKSGDDKSGQSGSGAASAPGCGRLGDYLILREVGRGGMGIVYEAEQMSLRRRVALKVLPFASAVDTRQLQRFQIEAQAAACLHHQHIVPVFAVGCERGVHYYAMQYIDGRSLGDVIRELRQVEGLDDHGPERADPVASDLAFELASGALEGLPPTGCAAGSTTLDVPQSTDDSGLRARARHSACATEPGIGQRVAPSPSNSSARTRAYCRTVARLGQQAAEALEHAHQQGIVHRDIKPANLMIDVRGNLWITDFGLARFQAETGLTLSGDMLGTLRYMSPEQAMGHRVVVDHRTDLYSLGVTLYEFLTFRPAIEGIDRADVLRRITAEEPKPLRRLNPSVPADLETILQKAMTKEPSSRYATAQAMADDLGRFLEDRPIQARRPSLAQRAKKWARRNRILVGASGVGLAAVMATAIAILAVSNSHIRQEQKQTALERDRAEANFRLALDAVNRYFTRVSEDPKLKARDLEGLRRELLVTARDFYERFVDERRNDPRVRLDLGRAYGRLGLITNVLGSQAEAIVLLQRSRDIFDGLAAGQPDVLEFHQDLAKSHVNLGELYRTAGRWEAAEAAHLRALALRERLAAERSEIEYQDELADSYNNLAAVYHATGRRALAEDASRKALAVRERLARAHPAVPSYQEHLATSYNNLGLLHEELGRRVEAESAYRNAATIWDHLVREHPAEPEYAARAAGGRVNLGAFYIDEERLVEAEVAFLSALPALERLAREHPQVPRYQKDLAFSQNYLGIVARAAGRFDEAGDAYRKAIAVRERLAREFPEDMVYATDLGGSNCNMGTLIRDRGQLDVALGWYDKAIQTLGEVLRRQPAGAEARQFLGYSHAGRAETLDKLGRPADALPDWDRAVALERGPNHLKFRWQRVACLARAGQHARATAEADELAGEKQVSADAAYNLACVYSLSSAVADQVPDRERYAARALALLRQAAQKGYRDVANMRKDTDLDPIRNRSDFQGMMTDLAFPTDPFAR